MTKKPAPRPAARKTAEQLRSAAWPDQKTALRDLKAGGMAPRGEDYELREYQPGSWQIMPLGDALDGGSAAAEVTEPSREEKVIESLRRKPGAKRRGEPEVIAHAKAPAKQPGKPPGKPKAASLFPPEADEAPPAKPPGNPLEPLPSKAGPYEVFIKSADDKSFADNAVVAFAFTVSKTVKVKVHIRNGAGEVVREIDQAAIRAAARGKGRGRPNNAGGARATGKSAEAAKLLMRPQGATFAEVVAITEWGISERFVRRLARANKCEPEQLGEKHWRLIKPAM